MKSLFAFLISTYPLEVAIQLKLFLFAMSLFISEYESLIIAKNVSIKNKHKQYKGFTWFTADQSPKKKAKLNSTGIDNVLQVFHQ